jgi:hypothetical protein
LQELNGISQCPPYRQSATSNATPSAAELTRSRESEDNVTSTSAPGEDPRKSFAANHLVANGSQWLMMCGIGREFSRRIEDLPHHVGTPPVGDKEFVDAFACTPYWMSIGSWKQCVCV